MAVKYMTRVLISLFNDTRLDLTVRSEAAEDGDARVFDQESFEIPEGIVGAIKNAQKAEVRGYELLAVWLKKNRPDDVEKFQLERYLPKVLR